ncbi:unnamed protein product [Boreogadus saida]
MLRSEPGMAVLIKNRPTSITTGGGAAEHGCRDLSVIRAAPGLHTNVPVAKKSVKEHCVWFLFFGPPGDFKKWTAGSKGTPLQGAEKLVIAEIATGGLQRLGGVCRVPASEPHKHPVESSWFTALANSSEEIG